MVGEKRVEREGPGGGLGGVSVSVVVRRPLYLFWKPCRFQQLVSLAVTVPYEESVRNPLKNHPDVHHSEKASRSLPS